MIRRGNRVLTKNEEGEVNPFLTQNLLPKAGDYTSGECKCYSTRWACNFVQKKKMHFNLRTMWQTAGVWRVRLLIWEGGRKRMRGAGQATVIFFSMQRVVQVWGGEWEEEEFSGRHTSVLKNKHWNRNRRNTLAESVERSLTRCNMTWFF